MGLYSTAARTYSVVSYLQARTTIIRNEAATHRKCGYFFLNLFRVEYAASCPFAPSRWMARVLPACCAAGCSCLDPVRSNFGPPRHVWVRRYVKKHECTL